MARSCSTTITYFFDDACSSPGHSSTLVSWSFTSPRRSSVHCKRCLTSRKELTSSNMYTSALRQRVQATANRWSSPPDKSSMFRSNRGSRSRSRAYRSIMPRSSLLFR
mmetsp:Transcript_23246/g.56075  ORF Transcript_23246/g.56075 Transcript_23246/m.56075 type:complete len:108 (+) Transcript_23246:1210-1533(+)